MQPSGAQRNRPDRPLAERRELARDLARHVGDESVLWNDVELLAYDVDGFTLAKFPPDLVVLPRTTEEVASILTFARTRQLPVTARGAGTGLAGGALAEEGGILLVTARMDRVFEVDAANRFAVVQPGVVCALDGMDRIYGGVFDDAGDPAIFEVVRVTSPGKHLETIVLDSGRALYLQSLGASTRFNLLAVTGIRAIGK